MSFRQALAIFSELLKFWQAYYSRKGRDCVSLAFSSDLPFPVWQKAVDQLQRSLEARRLGDGMLPHE